MSAPMHVLLVDPDPSVADAIRPVIGGNVRVATAAEAAFVAAEANADDLDLVLLSFELPDLDGAVACRQLAASLPNVPILAYSANGDEATMLRAFDAGAHDFLPKPLRLGELAARIRGALRLRRVLQRARRLAVSNRDLESTICNDPLTGIANRRHFENLLHTEWRRAAREGSPLSIAIFDLDDFHAFNTHYGHIGGDACLVQVAKAMAHGLRRASDLLTRYGGEEFVALLPDTDERGACVVAERLRARVEELAVPHAGSRTSHIVTVSVGVATCTPGANDDATELLVAAADAALFRAKDDGRNCCRADGVTAEHVVVSRQPWPTCPLVVLDPYFARRAPRMLDGLRSDVANALARARAGHLPSGTTAHATKRVSTQLGVDELGTLGTSLLDAIASLDHAAATKHLDALGWYLNHVQVVYRHATRSAG
jgi:diguanylate cyclase (GGDEF)-like protein